MKKICRLYLCGLAGVLLTVLMSSCAAFKSEETAAEKETDRFAFLHRGEKENGGAAGVSERESVDDERVSPGNPASAVLTPEQMARLGVEAAPEVSQEVLATKPAKFYEDLIALKEKTMKEISFDCEKYLPFRAEICVFLCFSNFIPKQNTNAPNAIKNPHTIFQ